MKPGDGREVGARSTGTDNRYPACSHNNSFSTVYQWYTSKYRVHDSPRCTPITQGGVIEKATYCTQSWMSWIESFAESSAHNCLFLAIQVFVVRAHSLSSSETIENFIGTGFLRDGSLDYSSQMVWYSQDTSRQPIHNPWPPIIPINKARWWPRDPMIGRGILICVIHQLVRTWSLTEQFGFPNVFPHQVVSVKLGRAVVLSSCPSSPVA